MLVATLSDEWGYYRTPAGKAVYFTLASQLGITRGDCEPQALRGSRPHLPRPR
jgi:hypothetical protein